MSWIYIFLFPYSSASISITIIFSFFSRIFPYKTRPIQYKSLSLPYIIIFGILNKFLLNLIFSFGTIFSLIHTAIVMGIAFIIIETVSIIGITGQICSGKTTLTNYLRRKYRATIINIDELNREVLLQEEVLSEIEKAFGPEVFWFNPETKRRELNKPKIREIIFKDPKKKHKLESITHSRVFMKFFQIMIAEKLIKRNKYVFIENALLLRFFVFKLLCNSIICVCVRNQEKLIERILSRDKCDETIAKSMIKNQLPLGEFQDKSNIVIYNDDININEFTQQIDGIMNKLFPFNNAKCHHCHHHKTHSHHE